MTFAAVGGEDAPACRQAGALGRAAKGYAAAGCCLFRFRRDPSLMVINEIMAQAT